MKYLKSNKAKAIAGAILFTIVFSLGAFARPGIDMTSMLVSSIFTSKEVYSVPPSEYETEVNELWQSQSHQAVCKANAAATVSIQLARKYLDEADKQNALAQYETPLNQALINVSKKNGK